MPLNNWIPFFKFAGSLVLPMLYIVSFASKGWVMSDDREWGLWEWCFRNISEDPTAENYDNSTQKCHSISPGDSAGYYEGVRTIATFTLVFHIAYFGTFNDKEGLGKDKNPMWVALVAMLGAVTTLGVLADSYEEDKRWENDAPFLGWCFWLVTACAILNLPMMFVFSKFDDMKKGTSSPAVSQSPERPPQRRASNASTLSIDRGRKVTIFRTTESGGASIHGTPSSAGRTSRGAGASASAEPSSGSSGTGSGSRGMQSYVLPVPRYDVGPEPGREVPSILPPSYEEVTRGGAFSPPPAYTVTPSGVEKME